MHTTDRAILTTFTATYKEYKETLIEIIDDLTRLSYIAKLKITSCWYRTKSKATTGLKNIASYIPWLYTTWDQMVASKMIHCVLVLMTTIIKQAFFVKFKQCFFIIFMLIIRIKQKTNLLLWQLWRTVQNYKNFMSFTVFHRWKFCKMCYFSKWMPY